MVIVENIWKTFRKGESATTLRDAVAGLFRRPVKKENAQDFQALQNISFHLKRGEALGIIGPNGAGKSTLLKVLAKVLKPDQGTVAINGRLSALIEITAGFHPDLTGRENIFLQGAVLGMSRKHIQSKLDAIVDFSGVRDFIDTPVKRYSSGMYVRLGFAVAAHIDPEILLIDEVLAVGDLSFQKKCLERITEMKNQGTAIIFISHNLDLVGRLCDKTFYLNHGKIMSQGPTQEVLRKYQNDMLGGLVTKKTSSAEKAGGKAKDVAIYDVRFLNQNDHDSTSFEMSAPMKVQIKYRAQKEIESPCFGIGIFTADGIHCVGGGSTWDGCSIPSIKGEGMVEIAFPSLSLAPGLYLAEVSVWDKNVLIPFDYHQKAYSFQVTSNRETRGHFYLPRTWRHLPSIDSQELKKEKRTAVQSS